MAGCADFITFTKPILERVLDSWEQLSVLTILVVAERKFMLRLRGFRSSPFDLGIHDPTALMHPTEHHNHILFAPLIALVCFSQSQEL